MSEFFPVHFVYLGPDGREEWDTAFTAQCVAVPRVGERMEAGAGGWKVVHRVYHRLVSGEFAGRVEHVVAATVVLAEPPADD